MLFEEMCAGLYASGKLRGDAIGCAAVIRCDGPKNYGVREMLCMSVISCVLISAREH